MKRYLVSYSTQGFYQRHEELNESARKFGLTNIIEFYDADFVKTEFYNKNRTVADNPKGAGFWIWKPFFIKEALKKINEGDVLFYVDAASIFVQDPSEIFKLAEQNVSGIIPFDARPLTNKQFCKRDSFINLGCDNEKAWHAWHVIATMIVIRKTIFSESFVNEWLEACQNPYSLVNNNNTDQFLTKNKELPEFIDHRSDQSILSLLVAKHNLETFRNPTVWGNYLKLKEYRVPGEVVQYPFLLDNSISTYSDNPMINSPYGTIFEINRGKDPVPIKYNKVRSFFGKIISDAKGRF